MHIIRDSLSNYSLSGVMRTTHQEPKLAEESSLVEDGKELIVTIEDRDIPLGGWVGGAYQVFR